MANFEYTSELFYQFFPRSKKITDQLQEVVDAFQKEHVNFNTCDDNGNETFTSDRDSNKVLACVAPRLKRLNFKVETSKKDKDKINVPVLWGVNGIPEKYFEADAWHAGNKIVIEVEAGRAYLNNQFLKDIFQACVMEDTDYLVLAVRKMYNKSPDFKKIYNFLETLYASDRLVLPLKGILLIGY